MNTKRYLNNKRSGIGKWKLLVAIIGVALLVASFPVCFSVFYFYDYLNLQNGNIISEYSFFNINYYTSERPSEISPMMSPYAEILPRTRLLIRKKRGFLRYQLKNAKCYTELVELFLNSKIDNSAVSYQELMVIINKYIAQQRTRYQAMEITHIMSPPMISGRECQ